MVKVRSWKRTKPALPSPYLAHVTAAVRRRKDEETRRHAEEEALKRAGTEAVHAEDTGKKRTLHSNVLWARSEARRRGLRP